MAGPTKTPEDIKKALACPVREQDYLLECSGCSYHGRGKPPCLPEMHEDALAYIRQLEAVRDALMQDLPVARCHICAHCYDEICCDVPMDERGDWLGPCKAFVWRGVPDQEDAHDDT